MSRGNNFFALPSDDQLQSLAKTSGQTNASDALGLQRPAPTPTHSNINTNTNNNNNNNEALQQVMGLLQQLMNNNNNSSSQPKSIPQSSKPSDSTSPPSITTTTTDTKSAIIKPTVPSLTSSVSQYEYPSPLTDLIYVGGAGDARNKIRLKALNIQFIINLCPNAIPQFFPSDFIYKDFDVTNNPANVMVHWEQFKTYMDNCINSGMKVFVHDETGEWKAPALVMAYMCTLFQWNLKEVYDFSRSRRREIKFPPQCLVALGNWEISYLGPSTLTEIVLSKKQKNKFSKNGGEILTDKSLQGFLSNRQARAIFDDYEEQITSLTIQHRDVYNQYLQLQLHHAKLEYDIALGKANQPISYDMSLFISKNDLHPFIDYTQTYESILQEYNSIFALIYQELKNDTTSTTTTTTTTTTPSQLPLPNEMATLYQTISTYISTHSSTLLSTTNNNINVAFDNDGKPISPQYTTIGTLYNNGYLTLSLDDKPLQAQNQPNITQSTTPITEQQKYTICLYCNTICTGHNTTSMSCQCSNQRSQLVQQFSQQFTTNTKSIPITYQTLYLLSTTFSSLFTPKYLLQTNPQQQSTTTTSTTKSKYEQYLEIHSSLIKLQETIKTTLTPKLPTSSTVIPTLSGPSQIDPQFLQTTKTAHQDFITLSTSLEQLFNMICQDYKQQQLLLTNIIIQEKLVQLIPIYNLTITFNSLLTIYQSQLLALHIQWSSSSSGDSKALTALQLELQTKQADLDSLQSKIKVLEQEHDDKIKVKESKIKERDDEIIILKAQAGGSTDVVVQLQEQLKREVDKRENVEKNNSSLQIELDELKSKQKQEAEQLQMTTVQKDELQIELDKLKSTVLVEKEQIVQKNDELQQHVVEVEAELAAIKLEIDTTENEARKTQIAVQNAQLAKLQSVSNDQEALQAETLRQVISILQSQKIWLGMQLGVTKNDELRRAYTNSLTKEQLQIQLKGKIPDAFIYVLDVTGDSVAQKCGVQTNDIIVSFNGTLISTVKQIHSIATDITPGDNIAIAVLRPIDDSNTSYTPMVLSMETRSRILSSQQLGVLRSIHRGDTLATTELLAQVMELKSLCDQDAANPSRSGPILEQRRSSIPNLARIATDHERFIANEQQ